MGWNQAPTHPDFSRVLFSFTMSRILCACLRACRNKGPTSLDDTILISIVHPECRESHHASGRAHAGRCSKLLTNCSPPARRQDGEYRAGLVASTVKRQSPETSQLLPLPQSVIYSLARDLRTAAASCGRDSTIYCVLSGLVLGNTAGATENHDICPVHPCGSRLYSSIHPTQLIPTCSSSSRCTQGAS
jgi:hypothetical protein